MFLLVDYQQTNFKVDNRVLAKDFIFKVAARKSIEIPNSYQKRKRRLTLQDSKL
ncbi:50S ribosomal protein L23 [Bacillus sp. IT-79MI2]